MLKCYTALIELDGPESAVHATAILDHLAPYHSAVAQTEVGQPELTLTLPAEDLAHAIQTSLSLMRVAGHRPVRPKVLSSRVGLAADYQVGRACPRHPAVGLNLRLSLVPAGRDELLDPAFE
jgi:hypothetical protein